MSERIEAFIFDMDGLMVETESLHLEVFEQFLHRKGVKPPREFINSMVGVSIHDNVLRARAEYGLKGDPERLVKERNDLYLAELQEHPLHVMPGVPELFDFAEEHSLRRAVCTSSERRQLDAIIPRVLKQTRRSPDPREFFDALVCGDEVEHLKPAPDIYELCADRLGLPAPRCLTFEDSPAGAQSAVAAGMQVAVVPNPFNEPPDGWPTPHVFDSLSEILKKGAVFAAPDGIKLQKM